MDELESIILNENEYWPDPNNIEQKENAIKFSEQFTDNDKKLQELLVEKKILEFDQIKDKGIRIKSQNYIGSATFSMFHLKIIPKIYTKKEKEVWKNIATCINFIQGFSSAKILEYQKISFQNENDFLQDFIIWSLVFECESLLQRGLLKSYVEHEENLPYLRGKLVLKNQFLNDVQKKAQFFCEFDELEYDNIENRIIFYSLLLCEKIAISPNLKQNVFKLIQQFSSMVQKTPIFVSDVTRVQRNYNRQNLHYNDAHSICKLILEHVGISDFYHTQVPFSIPFFVNMDDVFEDFVTLLFQKYSNSDDVESQVTQKGWDVDEKTSRTMKPDIILRKNQSLTIVDVKYKPKLSTNDLYQIGFYIHEYRDKFRNPKDNEAYAIMPRYPKLDRVPYKYVATETGITIYERHICLNVFLNLILNDKTEELRSKISRILIPN
jgi:5-methylcytosine-specific restriction enzyme subunit McrC